MVKLSSYMLVVSGWVESNSDTEFGKSTHNTHNRQGKKQDQAGE